MENKKTIDYSKNSLNLRYDPNSRRFDFPSKSIREQFVKNVKNDLFKNPGIKIVCNHTTFSARDGFSEKFTGSRFYELMLQSLNMETSQELIRNVNRFYKLDINYDEHNGLFKKLVRIEPDRYTNKDTEVCYIYKPFFKDEMYDYDLYVKFYVRGNEVNVMSLHWADNDEKFPTMVHNRKTNEWDHINKVMDYLEEKARNNYKQVNIEQDKIYDAVDNFVEYNNIDEDIKQLNNIKFYKKREMTNDPFEKNYKVIIVNDCDEERISCMLTKEEAQELKKYILEIKERNENKELIQDNTQREYQR